MVPRRVANLPDIRSGDIAVCSVIAMHDQPDGDGEGCTLGIREIAKLAHTSKRFVEASVRWLEYMDVISAEPDPKDARRVTRRIIWHDSNGNRLAPQDSSYSEGRSAEKSSPSGGRSRKKPPPFRAKTVPLASKNRPPCVSASDGNSSVNQAQQNLTEINRIARARSDVETPRAAQKPENHWHPGPGEFEAIHRANAERLAKEDAQRASEAGAPAKEVP